ncbi:MAG: hypothetical protein GY700_03715, partial [Propionibacteriaceae bacterium]|nr:hypothetical protein [Propionibacteriaceae bacterium]
MAQLFASCGIHGSTSQVKVASLTVDIALFGPKIGVVNLTAPSGTLPVPEDDPVPDVALLSFRFGTAVEDGDSSTAVFDPFERVHLESFRGSVVVCDGMTRNREFDGTNAINLEIEAPQTAPTVAAQAGSPNFTATSIVYRYRYKNSTSGKVSGLSP